MRHALIRHPDTPCSAVTAIEVYVSRGATGNLLLHYYLAGGVDDTKPSLRSPSTCRRADELWGHTCFEAFVKPAGSEAYWEFNAAPNRDWQAYKLSGYRAGRRPAPGLATPSVVGRYGRESWELRAHWSLSGIVPGGPWRIGLAAVIQDNNGAISYWALKHAPDKPDFHHPDAFALTVTP